MKRSDLKYHLAYSVPIFCWVGLYYRGWVSPGMFYLTFCIIPLIEVFLSSDSENVIVNEKELSRIHFFDLLLYMHISIVYSLLMYFLLIIANTDLTTIEYVGLTFNMGAILGSMGINIDHELGHHQNIGTTADPKSAMKNEPLYAFWMRPISGVYQNAWSMENSTQSRSYRPYLTVQNRMKWFTLATLSYLLIIYLIFGLIASIFAIASAIVAILLLETVNYIEHYGRRRKKLISGRYKPIQNHHSRNSNQPLGRLFLFELTRHADYHYRSTIPYQILGHYDQSPQLPTGYQASITLRLILTLWINKINPLSE